MAKKAKTPKRVIEPENAPDDKAVLARRSFLALAAVGAPAAAAAAVTGSKAKAETAPLAPDAAGYRKTEHVEQYLKTARF